MSDYLEREPDFWERVWSYFTSWKYIVPALLVCLILFATSDREFKPRQEQKVAPVDTTATQEIIFTPRGGRDYQEDTTATTYDPSKVVRSFENFSDFCDDYKSYKPISDRVAKQMRWDQDLTFKLACEQAYLRLKGEPTLPWVYLDPRNVATFWLIKSEMDKKIKKT